MAATARETEAMITRVSPALKQQIEESAKVNHRSVAREVEHVLAHAYGPHAPCNTCPGGSCPVGTHR